MRSYSQGARASALTAPQRAKSLSLTLCSSCGALFSSSPSTVFPFQRARAINSTRATRCVVFPFSPGTRILFRQQPPCGFTSAPSSSSNPCSSFFSPGFPRALIRHICAYLSVSLPAPSISPCVSLNDPPPTTQRQQKRGTALFVNRPKDHNFFPATTIRFLIRGTSSSPSRWSGYFFHLFLTARFNVYFFLRRAVPLPLTRKR